MNVLVIGSGGREHALLWNLMQDASVARLYALPGNGGTTDIAESLLAPLNRIEDLHRAVLKARPDLVVVGPELPLAAGIVDRLQRDNIPCFGPTAQAARIETSKVFAKRLMVRSHVPTAEFRVFESFSDLSIFISGEPIGEGWVVKADGLAAGKGAFVCETAEEVLQHAHELLVENLLGEAGREVVVERRLVGYEASALFWCDGEHFAPLPVAQDYKRAYDGNAGPNTGGMGSFCPVPQVTPDLRKRVVDEIIRPVTRTLADEGSLFRGILYAGLMLTEDGPQVIEFNCRFGDPETQVVLPAWNHDIVRTMLACANGTLSSETVPVEAKRCAVCVVLAADGYPGSYRKQIVLRTVQDTSDHVTFHAGTARTTGQLVSTGGRVLNAVGFGSDLATARSHAYALAEQLAVPGLFYRRDIALT